MSCIEVEIRRHPKTRDGRTQDWNYTALDLRQREVARAVREEERPGVLLVSELAPVVTYGRRTPPSDFQAADLQAQGIDLVAVDRGGLATYHGPGQWVLFPVESLKALTGDPRGVRKAVRGLLEVALEVASLYDPSAQIREGCEMGVWTSRGKVASVGIHVKQGVLLHGMAVNGFQTPSSFAGVRPCGLDAPVAFLLDNSEDSEFLLLRDRLIDAMKAGVSRQFKLTN